MPNAAMMAMNSNLAASQARLNAQGGASDPFASIAALNRDVLAANTALGQARIGADASRYGADNALKAALAASEANRFGSQQSRLASQYGSDQSRIAAQYGADNALKAALEAASANRYGSDQATAQARIAAEAGRYGADRRLEEAGLAADASRYGADRRVDEAGLAAGASRYGSEQSRAAAQFAAQMGLEGVRAAQSGETGRANALIKFQRDKFNALMAHFQGLYGDAGPAAGPGVAAASPDFGMPTSVYGPGQVDAEVNAAVARNDARSAGLLSRERERLAGRGLGSSPQLSAIAARLAGQNLGANAEAERGIRLGAAEANARQGTAAAQQAADAYAGRQQEAIARSQVAASQRNALLAALAGLA